MLSYTPTNRLSDDPEQTEKKFSHENANPSPSPSSSLFFFWKVNQSVNQYKTNSHKTCCCKHPVRNPSLRLLSLEKWYHSFFYSTNFSFKEYMNAWVYINLLIIWIIMLTGSWRVRKMKYKCSWSPNSLSQFSIISCIYKIF